MKTFRAWIDERGSNEDRAHRKCELPLVNGHEPWPCRHVRMVDLERSDYRVVLRLMWRLRPATAPYFQVVAFFRPHRGTSLLRIGRL